MRLGEAQALRADLRARFDGARHLPARLSCRAVARRIDRTNLGVRITVDGAELTLADAVARRERIAREESTGDA